MSKKIAILQSNYIPWKGYFDIINQVDLFVLYDDVQYTKNDWRNRNKIKTPSGLSWLTIPTNHHSMSQLICETKVSDSRWRKKHWATIKQNYSKSRCFKQYKDMFEELYLSSSEDSISGINYKFIVEINKILGIDTIIKWSSDFEIKGGQTERLINICKACEADTYISGPAAKDYFDEEYALREGIAVEWMEYNHYPEYSQMFGDFEHGVSVLDLIFNEGEDAHLYISRK